MFSVQHLLTLPPSFFLSRPCLSPPPFSRPPLLSSLLNISHFSFYCLCLSPKGLMLFLFTLSPWDWWRRLGCVCVCVSSVDSTDSPLHTSLHLPFHLYLRVLSILTRRLAQKETHTNTHQALKKSLCVCVCVCWFFYYTYIYQFSVLSVFMRSRLCVLLDYWLFFSWLVSFKPSF